MRYYGVNGALPAQTEHKGGSVMLFEKDDIEMTETLKQELMKSVYEPLMSRIRHKFSDACYWFEEKGPIGTFTVFFDQLDDDGEEELKIELTLSKLVESPMFFSEGEAFRSSLANELERLAGVLRGTFDPE